MGRSLVKSPYSWLEAARQLSRFAPTSQSGLRGNPPPENPGMSIAELKKRAGGHRMEPAGKKKTADVILNWTVGMAGDDIVALSVALVL